MIMRGLFITSVICVATTLGLLLRNSPNPTALVEPGGFVLFAVTVTITGLSIPALAPIIKALVVAASMALCCQIPLFWIALEIFKNSTRLIYVSYFLATGIGAFVGGRVLCILMFRAKSLVALIGSATHFVFIVVAAGLQHGTTKPPITRDIAWISLLVMSWLIGWLTANKSRNHTH